MNALATALRRSLWLLLIGAVGGAAWSYWRDRTTPAAPGPAEWPPLEPTPTSDTPTTDETPTAAEPTAAETPSSDTEIQGFAAVPEPDPAATWIEPDDDGTCPITHPIKANDNSGIYHVPEGRFYERTKAERCYVDSDAAEADGYRRSKS
ncbi:MAG: hypothetical protein AAGD33_13055 [Actinomycetota bacterium]